jgi:hypothetical protein
MSPEFIGGYGLHKWCRLFAHKIERKKLHVTVFKITVIEICSIGTEEKI